jgi:hypothetical protein
MPVTEPRDEIDSWLGHEIEPLAPQPGTFELVHRRARRRKLNQALTATAGAVVVIAGAVLGPTVGPRLLSGHSSPQPVGALHSSPSPATSKPTSSASATPATPSPSQSETGTGLSNTTSGTSPPGNFRPTSITMVGTAVGAVIGQAGTPGHCGPPVADDCTSLAGTSTYGKSWYGVSAPVTGIPNGSLGVSQLRFLNLQYGWAFGPALQETSDYGRHWTPVPTFGLRVTDLEAAGSHAFVLLADCQGGGLAYASDCSTFSLYSIAAGSTTLQQIRLPAGLAAGALGAAGHPSSASLVIRGDATNVEASTGYLLVPSGDILSGSVGGGAWTYAGKAPCTPGAAAYSGAPLGAQLTVSNGALLMNCAVSGGSASGSSAQVKQLWKSSNGARWSKVSQPSAAGHATSLAATGVGQVVLATTAGIDYSPAGVSWQRATFTGAAPQGGFSYVGMTSNTQGVALPVDASLGEVFVTQDSGQTWSAFLISGS